MRHLTNQPEPAMLHGLEAVDWSATRHAYGPATDLPDLLQALAGPDRDAVDEALDDLASSVHHQGSIYPASAAVVPFLVQLAAQAHYYCDQHLWGAGIMADPRRKTDAVRVDVQAALATDVRPLTALHQCKAED